MPTQLTKSVPDRGCPPQQRTRRWWKRILFASLAVLVMWQFGCVGPVKGLYPPADGDPRKTVHIIRHSWHTGIIVRRVDVPDDALPVMGDFQGADYVEFGWGDDEFYRAPRLTVGKTLKAALWPTPSVMHVVGLQGTPRANFPNSEIVEVELSLQGWEQMADYIDGTFERDADNHLMPLEKGLYGESRFYRARGKFYFPKMCNKWCASALRAAGCPITRGYALNAANVMWQTRRFGRDFPSDPLVAPAETLPRRDLITHDERE